MAFRAPPDAVTLLSKTGRGAAALSARTHPQPSNRRATEWQFVQVRHRSIS